VKWRVPDGRAYLGRLELGQRALHLVGAGGDTPVDREIGYDELGQIRIGHERAERIEGRRAAVIELADGTYCVSSATGETGVLRELVDSLSARTNGLSAHVQARPRRAIIDPGRRRRRWSRRGVLIALELVVTVNAIGGGVYGLAGAPDVPRSWLDGSPFSSYLIPSLALLLCVGGSAVVGLAASVTGHIRAPELAIGCGAVLLTWLVVEMAIIPFSWLQPTFLALAAAILVCGWRLRQ